MNKSKAITATFKASTLVGVFSLIILSSSQAAIVPPSSPEGAVSLGAPVGAIPHVGTVISQSSSYFQPGFEPGNPFTGILNSYVVQTAGAGSPLDFYYQLVNTTPAPDPGVPPLGGDEQITRLSIQGGFGFPSADNTVPYSVEQTNTSPFGVLGVGLKPASTVDRSEPIPTNGNLGFNFPTGLNSFTNNPLNVASGQSSSFLVVHSNATTFTTATARVLLNGGLSEVGTFAAAPEPSSVLFGLGLFGVALTSRAKRRLQK